MLSAVFIVKSSRDWYERGLSGALAGRPS